MNEINASVIVPVNNCAPYLSRCLESLLAQSFESFEIVCVDDGSTDGSGDILAQFAARDNRIRVISQQNKGVSCARNYGMETARGQYFLFVDGDDFVEPRFVETMLAAAQDGHANMVICSFDEYYESAQAYLPRERCEENGLYDRCFSLKDLEGLSTCLVTPNVWRVCFERAFLEAGNIRFDERLSTSEDLAFLYQSLFAAERIALVPDYLYHYRRENSTPSLTRQNRHEDGLKALELIKDSYEKHVAQAPWLTRHFVNLALDTLEYQLGSCADRDEFRTLYEGLQNTWRPFAELHEDLITGRYWPFYERTSSKDPLAYLFFLRTSARDDNERLNARIARLEDDAEARLGRLELLEREVEDAARLPFGNAGDLVSQRNDLPDEASSTASSHYYRIALVAPLDYQEGDLLWRTYRELIEAGHAVEIIDPRRYPAILDESGNLAESAFSSFRAAFRPDYVSFGSEDAGTILARCREQGTGMDRPAKRFVIFGYLGRDNFGDELAFSIIARYIADRWPESHVSVIGHDVSAVFARHGVTSVLPNERFLLDIMLDGAAALIYFAGVLFDRPWFDLTAGRIDLFLNPYSELPGQTANVLLAWMHNVPTVYLGIGAGPLDNPDAQAALRLSALCHPIFCLRDPEARRLLEQAGIPEELMRDTADLALSLAPAQDACPSPDETTVTVCLRDFEALDDSFAERTAQALDAIVERFSARIVFLDLAPEDRDIHARTAACMRHSKAVSTLDASRDLDAAISQLSASTVVLAMRLHGSIVANAFDVPSVGFNYSEKVLGHYRLMEQEKLLCSLDASAETIAQTLSLALEHHAENAERVRERARELAQRSRLNFTTLEEVVESHRNLPSHLRIYQKRTSPEGELLEALRAEHETLRREHEATLNELREMRESTIWKTGSALTALPRALKDRRSKQRP